MTDTSQAARLGLPETPPVAGLHVRYLTDDADYAPLSAVIRECHLHDGVPWLPTADNVRLDMRRDGIDPTRDVVLVEAAGGLVALMSVQRQVRDDLPVYDVWGKVVPAMRRRGIGRWLLDWGLGRAAERAEGEDPDGSVLVGAHVEEQETGARILYEQAGFVPVRQFFLMQRTDLDGIPDVALPEGLEIRPVQPDQHRTIFDAENEAFRDHWGYHEHGEEAFRQTFGQAETNTDLWVVAWEGDQVAGVVENWIWPEENERLGVRRGWLERISVRRPWRRRGLGRALTAAALTRLREAGMDEAMLGVDAANPTGALGLYERLGFEVARRSAAYQRPLRPGSP
jgi:mycothiol synthase